MSQPQFSSSTDTGLRPWLSSYFLAVLDGDGLHFGVAFHAFDRGHNLPRRRQDDRHAQDFRRLFRKVLFLLDLGQPILEPLGKFGFAGLFLGAVALDVQPRRVVVEPHLPQLAVVLGDLLVRLADKELQRLADVLLLDAQFPGPALLDLAEVFGRYLVQRPVDDPILVGGRLADRLRRLPGRLRAS